MSGFALPVGDVLSEPYYPYFGILLYNKYHAYYALLCVCVATSAAKSPHAKKAFVSQSNARMRIIKGAALIPPNSLTKLQCTTKHFFCCS